MIAAGYMAKVIAPKPEWIRSDTAVRICSVSNCISGDFCDYVHHWKHNGFWFFNSPADIQAIAESDAKAAKEFTVFYYELYEAQYDDKAGAWISFQPEEAFQTDVRPPSSKELLGFDVVTYLAQTSAECSPLSCNNLAEKIPVNESCLLPSLDEAKQLIESGAFQSSEPGPFRIIAVYKPVSA